MGSHCLKEIVLAVAIACVPGWVLAEEFSVGRVDVVFGESGWQEIVLKDTKRAYDGDASGELSVQSKAFVHRGSNGEPEVMVVVSANSYGLGGVAGTMHYSGSCTSNEEMYREGNIRMTFAQCLTVLPKYTAHSVLKALAPELLAHQGSDGVNIPSVVYTVWSRHAISTGSFVEVKVFLTSNVVADPSLGGDVPSSILPPGVQRSHVAWGRMLKDAVKSSVYSLSGRLDIPRIVINSSVSFAPAIGD